MPLPLINIRISPPNSIEEDDGQILNSHPPFGSLNKIENSKDFKNR
jgi:hypothetical protein